MAKQSTSRVKIKIIWTLPPKLRGGRSNIGPVEVVNQYEQTPRPDQQEVNADKSATGKK